MIYFEGLYFSGYDGYKEVIRVLAKVRAKMWCAVPLLTLSENNRQAVSHLSLNRMSLRLSTSSGPATMAVILSQNAI